MLVYRIENSKGEGAYQILDEDGFQVLITDASDTHPMPYDDDLLNEVDWEDEFNRPRFGFSDLNHFLSWFSQDMLDTLQGHAYLAVYDAQIVLLGEKQCIFDRDYAERIKRCPL